MPLLRRRPPNVHSQAQLHRLWRRLLAWSHEPAPVVKCLFIARDGRTMRTLVTLTDCTGPLEGDQPENFTRWLLDVVEDSAPLWRVALLVCRPGPRATQARDLRWAASLRHATLRSGASCEVIHLRAGGRVVPLPLDDFPADAISL